MTVCVLKGWAVGVTFAKRTCASSLLLPYRRMHLSANWNTMLVLSF